MSLFSVFGFYDQILSLLHQSVLPAGVDPNKELNPVLEKMKSELPDHLGFGKHRGEITSDRSNKIQTSYYDSDGQLAYEVKLSPEESEVLEYYQGAVIHRAKEHSLSLAFFKVFCGEKGAGSILLYSPRLAKTYTDIADLGFAYVVSPSQLSFAFFPSGLLVSFWVIVKKHNLELINELIKKVSDQGLILKANKNKYSHITYNYPDGNRNHEYVFLAEYSVRLCDALKVAKMFAASGLGDLCKGQYRIMVLFDNAKLITCPMPDGGTYTVVK